MKTQKVNKHKGIKVGDTIGSAKVIEIKLNALDMNNNPLGDVVCFDDNTFLFVDEAIKIKEDLYITDRKYNMHEEHMISFGNKKYRREQIKRSHPHTNIINWFLVNGEEETLVYHFNVNKYSWFDEDGETDKPEIEIKFVKNVGQFY